MNTLLKDFDLDLAKERMRSRIDFARHVATDFGWTELIRDCKSAEDAAFKISVSVLDALLILPTGEGGTVAQVGPNGEWEAVLENITPDKPLVEALLTLLSYPGHRGFHGVRFERPGQKNGRDVGPWLDALRAAKPYTWSLAKVRDLIFEGMRSTFGDSTIDPDWLVDEIYPGSRISEYTHGLHKILLYDLIGAFAPGYTRADGLSGEWWLLQPVSPRLEHWQLAQRVGLEFVGYLPADHVDAEGRVVMVGYVRNQWTDEQRIDSIENNKFIAGWQKVMWSKGSPPLSDPDFKFEPALEGVTEDSYGSYKHSTELPRWPGSR